MRVVLDTNAVVSALLFEHGRLTWLRDAWSAGRILPLIDPSCLDELLRVLVVRGGAEVLVSGGSALPALNGRTAFAIESPAAFRDRLGV